MTATPAAPLRRPDRLRRVRLVLAVCLIGGVGGVAGALAVANGDSFAAQTAAGESGSGNGSGRGGGVEAEIESESRVVTPLATAQPRWRELSDAQREILQPFAAQWNSLSASEKRSWAVLADRLPRMEAEARQRARHRIGQWAELTPEQRRIARMNYRLASQLSPEERKAQWERYTSLTSEQQRVLRTSGWTSNTAARHAGARTGLAKEAAQPLVPYPPDRPRAPGPAQPAADR